MMDASVLQIDGCWVERNGIQHYTYPREMELEALSLEELAIAEYLWHTNPEWQGQVKEGQDEVNLSDYAADFDAAIQSMLLLDMRPLPFPRQLWDGKNDNILALLEWQWHTNRDGIIMELFLNSSRGSNE